MAITRTIHFDKLIDKSKDKVEQFVVMGAGYATLPGNVQPGRRQTLIMPFKRLNIIH
ncbi:MAG TPA: hypothetical protein VFD10_01105 [Atribacterota bacterium]|nr:hypothetical protein [Atribacterota bacterium]